MQGGRNPFFGFGDPFGSFGGLGGAPFGSFGGLGADPFGGVGGLGADPFGGVGGLGGNPFGNFGGLGGGQRSLVPNLFGGRDPFSDPFFTQPFGSMFEPRFLGSNGGPFMNRPAPGFIEHRPPQPNLSRGPVIEELNSDDEKDEEEKKENPRKHRRSSKEPVVEDPDDEVTEKKIKHMANRSEMNQMQHVRPQPQMHSLTFQSSSVSYGGPNGTYYTSSTTRRAGSNGLAFEEFKEADSSTRQATHRVSRGIHNKGHSLTRKLKSDGHVDSMQTLHNLNEDDLVGFEEAWAGNARKHLPGWSEQSASRDVIGSGHVGSRGNLALPSTVRPQHSGRTKPDLSDGMGASRGRSYRGGPSQQGSRRH